MPSISCEKFISPSSVLAHDKACGLDRSFAPKLVIQLRTGFAEPAYSGIALDESDDAQQDLVIQPKYGSGRLPAAERTD